MLGHGGSAGGPGLSGLLPPASSELDPTHAKIATLDRIKNYYLPDSKVNSIIVKVIDSPKVQSVIHGIVKVGLWDSGCFNTIIRSNTLQELMNHSLLTPKLHFSKNSQPPASSASGGNLFFQGTVAMEIKIKDRVANLEVLVCNDVIEPLIFGKDLLDAIVPWSHDKDGITLLKEVANSILECETNVPFLLATPGYNDHILSVITQNITILNPLSTATVKCRIHSVSLQEEQYFLVTSHPGLKIKLNLSFPDIIIPLNSQYSEILINVTNHNVQPPKSWKKIVR